MTAAGVTPSSPTSTYAYGYTDANWGDKLTSYRGQTITYDEIGNPLSYYNGSSYTFTWKNGRQLATASKGATSLSFEYNDEGIRTSKIVNGVEHVYYLNGSQILAESWGSVLCVYLYDANGSPIGMQYRTTSYAEGVFDTFWFTKNVQGDIVSVYNNSGTKLLTYHYDAWGNFSTQWHTYTGSDYYASYNPFKYRGYYHDSETGFYYLNSRYYDPATGRFLNADSQLNTSLGILGSNQFSYCLNSPINNVDNGGNKPGDLFDTPDEAARDFGEYTNPKSIEDNREYASYIYKKTVTETRTVTLINPCIIGYSSLSWLWQGIFSGLLVKTFTYKVRVTKYTYVEPQKGTKTGVVLPILGYAFVINKVAMLHTHGGYMEELGGGNDVFSEPDMWIAEVYDIPFYVVTPLGTLLRYDPSTDEDIQLFDDLPYDESHPER